MSEQTLRRPRTERVRIEDLVLEDVPAGRYRVPAFQRPWRWTRDDVLDLFDSLWRGYPIGVMLCWTRPGEQEVLRLGEFSVELEARASAYSIIDGQQRVHALVGVLRHPFDADPLHRGSDFELYFDLKNAKFCHRDTPGAPDPLWVPMNRVASSAALASWLDDRDLRRSQPELYRRALDLGRMVREHELLLYVLDTDDEGAIRQLFARLNNTGRRLRETEVFDALHRGRGGPIDDLAHLAVEVGEQGFGAISEQRLLHVCLAVVGATFKSRLQGRLHRDAPTRTELNRVRPALFRALALLRDYAHIPTAADLPHSLSLCALAILCDRFESIDDRNAELLARFVWRGTATDVLNGRNQELSARVYRAARRQDAPLHAIVQALLAAVPSTPPGDEALLWRPTSGLSRLQLLALEAAQPIDLRTRELLSAEDLRPAGRAMSVVPVFGEAEVPDGPLRRSLGNHLLHPRVPGLTRLGPLLADLSRPQLFVPNPGKILASHLVFDEALGALRQGDVPRFVALRERDVRRQIQIHLDAHACWRPADRDRPPIDALVGDDEDEPHAHDG